MGALVRYCETGYEVKLIVSNNIDALAFVQQILEENHLLSKDIRLCTPEDLNLSIHGDVLVIVFELALKDALATSKQINHVKDKGIPVVFGNSRDVFFEKPNVSAQGISYAGMFQLCNNYLRGIKPIDSQKLAYAEFGVFDGRTCTLAWQIFKESLGHFYAFDSFRGILGKADGEEIYYQTGDYYANKETFLLNLQVCGADLSRFSVVECDFDSTLLTGKIDDSVSHQLGVVHIDCDVYPAAYHVLEFVTPHLADGCILLFDDYDAMWGNNARGERMALSRWKSKHPEWDVTEYRSYSATGKAFLCSRTTAIS